MDTEFINKYIEKLNATLNNITQQYIQLEARYEIQAEKMQALEEEVIKLQKTVARKRK